MMHIKKGPHVVGILHFFDIATRFVCIDDALGASIKKLGQLKLADPMNTKLDKTRLINYLFSFVVG